MVRNTTRASWMGLVCLLLSFGLQAAPLGSQGQLRIGLRVVASPQVPRLAQAWPAARLVRGEEEGQGFWMVPSSPAQAWSDLEALVGPLPEHDQHVLADGVEGWVALPGGCAHVIARQVQGLGNPVSRVEIRTCH